MQSVITTAVWRNDSLWTAHTINVGGEATVHWYEVTTTAGAYGIRQQGDVDPGPGLWTFLPGINVDGAGNMAITYTQTSASTSAWERPKRSSRSCRCVIWLGRAGRGGRGAGAGFWSDRVNG